jgi:hypothetical protein
MLSPQLRPFRELVLTARSIQLYTKLQKLALKFPLFSGGLRGRCWETVVNIPQLELISCMYAI